MKGKSTCRPDRQPITAVHSNFCRGASEAEDGELEAGELCEDGDSASNFKRARRD